MTHDEGRMINDEGRIGRLLFIIHHSSFIILALALVACADSGQPDLSDDAAEQREAAVIPELRAFYEQNGGAAIIGNPISGRCQDNTGRPVQFFQNLRLEFDASRPPEEQVILYPLGEWALAGVRQFVPADEPTLSPTRYFSQTHQALHGAFRTFYEANQGERLLGPPISPLLDEGLLRVQYFRNGRLEWRPDESLAYRVRLGLLGAANYLQRDTAGLTCGVMGQPVIPGPIRLLVTVREPILFAGAQQVIYVTAVGPDNQPRPDLNLVVTVAYNQQLVQLPLGLTNENGRVQRVLALTNPRPGQQVVVRVEVATAGVQMINDASLVFRTWW